MRKMLMMAALAVAAVLSVETASANAIWQIRSTGGQYHRYGMYVGQGAKAQFGVWPVAPGHSAGAVWTWDGWNTVRWREANWCWNQQGPYGNWDEVWLVAMWLSPDDYGPWTVDITYALYVDNQYGQRFWDNNNGMNYTLRIGQGMFAGGDPSGLHSCTYWW